MVPGNRPQVGRLRAPARRAHSGEILTEFIRRTIVACLSLGLAGCVNVQLFGGTPEPLVETVIYGESGPKILLLDIDGVISESSDDRGFLDRSEESMVARVREQLDRARADASVRGLLLRINSPGGTVTASDVIYQELLRFKQDREVPVVAHFMGVAASGGYYVAMAADELIAEPTGVTGSIGVIFVGVNISALMERFGVADQTLTAGAQKDAGSWLRPMRPAEREHLQSVLDDMHERFKQVVAAGRRGLDRARIDELADGRIYSASQAKANGLVDELGGLETTVAAVQRRAGIAKARVVSYHRPREYRKNLYTQAPAIPQVMRLELTPSLPLARPGFLYLWAPGLP